MKIFILVFVLFISAFCFARKETPTEIYFYSLEISSEYPINVTYYSDRFIQSELSQNNLTAKGENLEGIYIKNSFNDEIFKYKKRVSSTEYSSSFGVFLYNENYSLFNFNFIVKSFPISEENFLLPQFFIAFYPFYTANVYEKNVKLNFVNTLRKGEFLIESDNSLSLSGLSLSNNHFGMKNLVLLPQFEYNNVTENGNIVFQLEEEEFEDENLPYITMPCVLYHSQVRGGNVDVYDCEFDSISFMSISFDELLENNYEKNFQKQQPDQMAFSLF